VQTCQTRSVCKPGPPAYIQDLACIQGPASISTTTLDPRPVFEARLVFKARLIRGNTVCQCLRTTEAVFTVLVDEDLSARWDHFL